METKSYRPWFVIVTIVAAIFIVFDLVDWSQQRSERRAEERRAREVRAQEIAYQQQQARQRAQLAEQQRRAKIEAQRRRVKVTKCIDRFYKKAEQEGRIKDCEIVSLVWKGDEHFREAVPGYCLRWSPDLLTYRRDNNREGWWLSPSRATSVRSTVYLHKVGETFRRVTVDKNCQTVVK